MSLLKEQQFQFTKKIGELIVWLYENGYTAQQGDAWRSTDKLCVPGGEEGFDDDEKYSYQELLFYNRKSKVTYGKHNDRLAKDFIIYKNNELLKDEEYRPVGEKWESMGGKWGGRFGLKLINGKWVDKFGNESIGWDAGHFEW